MKTRKRKVILIKERKLILWQSQVEIWSCGAWGLESFRLPDFFPYLESRLGN